MTCEECGWSLLNDGDEDLQGELCLYRGCRGEFVPSFVMFRKWELPELEKRLREAKVQRA